MKRMNSKDFAPEVETEDTFKKYYDDPENTRCFECRSAARHWISVNNAISLCGDCAEKHLTFGKDISLVKNSQKAVWLPSELKILQHGGNRRFQNFLASYIFEPHSEMIFKYKTLAAFYYRRKLRLESEGKEYHDELPRHGDHLQQIESESIFDSIASGFSRVGHLITGAYERAKSGIQESHLVQDIQETTSKVTDDVKKFASSGIKAIKEGFNDAVDLLLEFQGTDVKNVTEPTYIPPEKIGDTYEFTEQQPAAQPKLGPQTGLRGTGDILDNKKTMPLPKEIPESRHMASEKITPITKHEKAREANISKGFATDKELPKKKETKETLREKEIFGDEKEAVEDGYLSDEEELGTKGDKLAQSGPTLKEKKGVLATLAREASDEVRQHDPSKKFDQKNDESFPETKLQGVGKLTTKEEEFRAQKLQH